MKILLTGATGKVGQHFIRAFKDSGIDGSIRAFCHNRVLEVEGKDEVFRGDISIRNNIRKAMEGITHVVHLSTTKENPDTVIDVSIKGLFWLLEECRVSNTFRQFIMVGGDSSMGHFFYPKPAPVTEKDSRTPYPGCYALSKALEENMLEYYYIQYNLNGCCLRAPWIMEKDDFKYTLSFGEDQFGGPVWRDFVGPEKAKEYASKNVIPLMLDTEGHPMKRNFVHVSDLVRALIKALDHPKAFQQLFNIAMDEPVDYGKVTSYLNSKFGFESVEISTGFYSTWYDTTKAKAMLGWTPEYDLKKLIDESYSYQRSQEEARKVWYPG